MPAREQESLMEGLGEDGMRGAVLSPQKEELGLGGMGGRTPSSLKPQRRVCKKEKGRAGEYFTVFVHLMRK